MIRADHWKKCHFCGTSRKILWKEYKALPILSHTVDNCCQVCLYRYAKENTTKSLLAVMRKVHLINNGGVNDALSDDPIRTMLELCVKSFSVDFVRDCYLDARRRFMDTISQRQARNLLSWVQRQ